MKNLTLKSGNEQEFFCRGRVLARLALKILPICCACRRPGLVVLRREYHVQIQCRHTLTMTKFRPTFSLSPA